MLSDSKIQRIHGNLFLIPNHLIEYSEDDKNFNPRIILAKMGVDDDYIPGFSSEDMTNLRESIRTVGLKHPLIVKKRNNKFILISGERRKRCIDRLIDDEAEVFDYRNKTGSCFVNASEFYKYIECSVESENITEKDFFSLAVKANSTAVDIGEGSTIALVKYFKNHGWSNNDILYVIGKNNTWLNEALRIIEINDEKIFKAFCNGKITRSALIKLSQIDDSKIREKVFFRSMEINDTKIKELLEKEKKSDNRIENLTEEVKYDLEMAKINNNPLKVIKLEDKLSKYENRKIKKRNIINNIKRKQTGNNEIEAAISDVIDDDIKQESKVSNKAKLSQLKLFWLPKLREYIEKIEIGDCQEDDVIIDPYSVKLSEYIISSFLEGQQDPIEVLKRWQGS